jgi:hypothetical protein
MKWQQNKQWNLQNYYICIAQLIAIFLTDQVRLEGLPLEEAIEKGSEI